MATIYFKGTAAPVAQVTTVTVGGTLAGETFTISAGGVAIASHTDATTVIADTITALVAAWNASTHPYATGITAAAASPTLTLTSDTAGVPFVVTLNTPGGAATLGQTATTASAGPNHWDAADNWSGGAVPVNGDVCILSNSAVNICWGLAQSAVTLVGLYIEKSYTGRIGLDYARFATSTDGATYSSTTKPEYRDTHLYILVNGPVWIGSKSTLGSPTGSSRILLNLGNQATEVTVFDTSSTPVSSGRATVDLLANSAATNVYVRNAPGGVSVAGEKPDETSTIGSFVVSDTTAGSLCYLSDGVTVTTVTLNGGNSVVSAAATITTLNLYGGLLRTEGDYTITTANQTGGTWSCNNDKSGGNAITTLNGYGGVCDFRGSREARTVATLSPRPGFTWYADKDVLTITTLNQPQDAGPYKVAVT